MSKAEVKKETKYGEVKVETGGEKHSRREMKKDDEEKVGDFPPL